jgi:1-acyl-sn-glycerol-3-phosphate acyltransferase
VTVTALPRTFWVVLNAVIATVPLSLVVMGAALLRVRDIRFYDWPARTWSRWILRASGARLNVEGLENVSAERAQVIISNHQSWYDVFALASVIPPRYRFIAKKELSRIPFFGPAWKASGHISIDRSNRNSAIRSLDQATRLVQQDRSSVVVFPEGTRSETGELLPFKKGAFMLALHAGMEIVPVGLSGGRRILKKNDWRVHSGEINVRFGRPIPTASYSVDNREELIARVHAEVKNLMNGHPPTD